MLPDDVQLYEDVLVENEHGYVTPGILMGWNHGTGTWDVNVFARSLADTSRIMVQLECIDATPAGLIVALHGVPPSRLRLRRHRATPGDVAA